MATATPFPSEPLRAVPAPAPVVVPLTPEQRADFDAVIAITAGHPEGIPGEKMTAMIQAWGLFEAKHGPVAWLRGHGMSEDEIRQSLAERAQDEREASAG
jgi:hypothetical protein